MDPDSTADERSSITVIDWWTASEWVEIGVLWGESGHWKDSGDFGFGILYLFPSLLFYR